MWLSPKRGPLSHRDEHFVYKEGPFHGSLRGAPFLGGAPKAARPAVA